jgi:hypothetical protein
MNERQYVYVLSEAEGSLVWLALSSAMTVRRCDPSSRLILITDEGTAASLPGVTAALLADVFDRRIDVPCPHPPGAVASRYLKTSIRQLVDGDLVFLDVDTLMFRAPLALFAGDHDVGACHDRNWEQWRPHRPEWVKPHYDMMGWSFSDRGYFNTGVLFLRDRAVVRRLGVEWHDRWASFLRTTGHHQDQPAFNSLIGDPSLQFRAFPLRYNAMVDAVPFFCWRALVVHYFLHGGRRLSPEDSVLWTLAHRWRSTGAFDESLYDECRRRRDPWVHPTRSIQIELATGRPGTALGLMWQRLVAR